MTNIEGAKRFILTTAVSSFARAQKMDTHTVAHHTTGVSTCPTLRGAKHFPALLTFQSLVCSLHSVHIFLLHKSNTDETIHGQLLHLVSIQERWKIEEK